MKKLLTILLLGIFLINLTSAGLLDPNSELDFHEVGKNGKFGYYEINDTDLWFFNNKPVKTVELLENDYSIFTAWNIKEIETFKPTKLFDKTNYLDKTQNHDKKNKISSELHLYREWQTKTRTIDNQSCLTFETITNGTNQTQVCSKYQDNSYEEEYKEWSNWKPYNFQIVQEGLYQTKTIVTRETQETGIIDWVDENDGWDLDKWAIWWDSSWTKKRVINLTSNVGNFSYLEVINYSVDMNSDFSDVRFLDSATESIELNFTIENKTDSDNIKVRIFSQGEDSFYMYYGNPSATTSTESSYETHFEPVSLWYFDETAGAVLDSIENNNATNTGAVPGTTGIIDNAYDFTPTDHIITDGNSGVSGASARTISFWTYAGFPGTSPSTGFFFSQGSGALQSIGMYVPSGSNDVFAWQSNDFDTGLQITDDWQFWSYVYDGTTVRIYLDGVAGNTGALTLNTDVDNLQISGRGGTTETFTGIIDEVIIHDKALSPSQIKQLSTYTEPGYTVGAEESLGAEVTLISPADATITSQTFQTFKCNSSFDTDLANLTFQLNGVDTFTNSTIGTFIDLTYSENITTEGVYNWSCRAETTGEQITQSTNRTITIHTTTPNITIHDPQPNINYYLLGDNLTLNWTITESGENLTEHIKNCTYEYNGVLTVLNNTLCTQINNTEFEYVLGINNLTFNVTDIFDLVNSTTQSWNIKLTEINQTFSNQTIEGSTQNLSALIRLQDGLTVSAVILDYDGTLSAGTSSESGDNILILESGLITPGVAADENITFHWSIVLSGGEIINLSNQNQTILNIGIDNCSAFTNVIFNMTIVDEKTQVIIINETELEIAINIFSEDKSTEVVNFSAQFDEINPVGICLEVNISEGVSYSLDAIIRYAATGYANEYYSIVDYKLDEDSETQNLTLYDLNSTDSTDFQLTFTGEDFLPVEDALVSVGRQYISENTFKTVELPKTDSNGQTILHLVRNDVIYNILVMKDGQVLGNFANVIAFCEDFTIGACTLPLNAISNASLIFNYDDEIGLIFEENAQFNETTRIVSFSFASTDGTTKLVSMTVERRDIFGNRTVCENSILSASGSLSCQVSEDIADTSLISIISVDGEDKIFSEVIIDDTGYGQNGVAMFFIFAIAMALMFSGSKTWTLIGLSLSYIFGVSLGFIIGGIAGVGSTGIFILIMTIVGIWQLNKERRQ